MLTGNVHVVLKESATTSYLIFDYAFCVMLH
jgi:hypothetical protein